MQTAALRVFGHRLKEASARLRRAFKLLRGGCVAVALGTAAPVSAFVAHAAQPAVGEVSFVRGPVIALAPDAAGGPTRVPVSINPRGLQAGMRALQIGDPVFEGELLASGPSGHLHIRTADGGFLALRPASSARIETFAFDPQRPADTRIRLILERGVMRAVSGAGAQASRERFRLNTPLAAIGIRGTDFTVESSDQHTRVAVHSGAVVLSAFSATCRPELLGPCLGDASRTLSADNPGGILELRRGEAEPRFLQLIARDLVPQAPLGAKARSNADPVAANPGANSVGLAGSAGSVPGGDTGAAKGGSGGAAGNAPGTAPGTPAEGTPTLPAALASDGSAGAAALVVAAANSPGTLPSVSEVQQSSLASRVADRAGGVFAADGVLGALPAASSSSSPASGSPGSTVVSSAASAASVAPSTASTAGGAAALAGSPGAPPAMVPLASWGRWAQVAGAAPGVDSVSFRASNGPLIAVNQAFLLALSNAAAMRLPEAGNFSFRLADAQAWETRQGVVVAPAPVDRGLLTVDFGGRRFSTGLELEVAGRPVALGSAGRVLEDGTLEGRLIFSDPAVTMNLRGSLAGDGASQAAYLFDAALNPSGQGVVGASSWRLASPQGASLALAAAASGSAAPGGPGPATATAKGAADVQAADLAADPSLPGTLPGSALTQPAVPVATWGRWAQIAGAAPGVDSVAFKAAHGEQVAVNQAFLLTMANRDALRMPESGSFAFKLADAQAWETRQGVLVGSAPIEKGQLTVDFAARRFSTGIDLVVGGQPVALGSAGRLLGDGTLEGRLIFSEPSVTMNLRGALAGKDATQAAYLFDAVLNSGGAGVLGAASWSRAPR